MKKSLFWILAFLLLAQSMLCAEVAATELLDFDSNYVSVLGTGTREQSKLQYPISEADCYIMYKNYFGHDMKPSEDYEVDVTRNGEGSEEMLLFAIYRINSYTGGYTMQGIFSVNVNTGVCTRDDVVFQADDYYYLADVPADIVDSGSCGDNLTWTLDSEGTLMISGTGPMQDYEICSTPWSAYFNTVTSLVIEKGVTSIGEFAFLEFCFRSIEIPEGLIRIGTCAFANCYYVEDICIPASVTTIGESAFSECGYMAEGGHRGIWVDANNSNYSSDQYGVLFNKDKTTLIQATNSLSGSYQIPSTVATIADRAFMRCSNLTSIEIPQGVTTIGVDTFYGCYDLTKIYIPKSVTSIKGAFTNCSSLADVYYGGTKAQWDAIYIQDSNGYGNEYLLNANIHSTMICAYAGNVDLTVSLGEEMYISYAKFEYDCHTKDWSKPAIAIEDDAVISVTQCSKSNIGYRLTVKGKKAGNSQITVTDADSGAYVTVTITVRNTIATPVSYIINDVPSFMEKYFSLSTFTEKEIQTNILDCYGLYINDFPKPNEIKKTGNNYLLEFNVYNEKSMYGAIDVYDKYKNWIRSYPIEKNTGIQGMYDTIEGIVYYLRDAVTDNFWNYTADVSSAYTRAEICVPEGGYFTISNNYLQSPGVYLYNSIDVVFMGADLVCDMTDLFGRINDEVLTFNKVVTDVQFQDMLMEKYSDMALEFSSKLALGDYGAAAALCSNSFFDFMDAIGLDFWDLAEECTDISEEIFKEMSPGFIETGLNLVFGIGKFTDAICQIDDIGDSPNKPFIIMYTPEAAKGEITVNGVTAIPGEGAFADDAVLQVFRISDTGNIVASDSGFIANQYDLYHICYTVDNKKVQPNGTVTIKIPIPDKFNRDACDVYHQQPDGTWKLLLGQLEGDFIVFEVKHFSLFALVDSSSSKSIAFVDITEDAYYYEPVLWAVNNGITNGLSADSFGPDATCTRAQIVTFLWRACGSPAPTAGNNPFTDVPAGQWYTDAVLWAVENNITTGTSSTTFSPDAGCTRGQVATFLWRSQQTPASVMPVNSFTDIDPYGYYYNAVLWAVENGITNGLSATAFGPDATCTRGQIVTFLYRNEGVQQYINRYTFHCEDVSWTEANEKAKAMGGHLVHLDSIGEMGYLMARIYEMDYELSKYILLGGRRELDEQVYYWRDTDGDKVGGSLNEAASWQNALWHMGEPSLDYAGEREAVMSMAYSDKDGRWGWNDVSDDLPAALQKNDPSQLGTIVYIVEYENWNDQIRDDMNFYSLEVDVSNPGGTGYNEDGRVNWRLMITARYIGTYSESSFACNIKTNHYKDLEDATDWENAKNGLSADWTYKCIDSGYGNYHAGGGYILPDDPSFAGRYTASITFGDVTKTATFTLVYNGNYETGTGWSVTDIVWE